MMPLHEIKAKFTARGIKLEVITEGEGNEVTF